MGQAYPALRQSACARYRFRYSACRRCADACPHDAIRLDDDGIALDAAGCQNCALCVSACRTAALGSAQVTPIDWIRKGIGRGRLSFACAQAGCEDAIRVPCLGVLDAATLAYLSRRGLETELLGADRCESCPHGAKGAAQLALNLDAVRVLAEAAVDEVPWQPIALGAGRGGNDAVRPERRQLFRRLVGRGIDAVAASGPADGSAPPPDKAIRAGAYFVPELRELLNIVRRQKAVEPRTVAVHPALAATDLAVDRGCSHCEACFRACPTGALQIDESADRWSLAFEADRCVGCEVCIEVCQPRVLHAAATLPPPDAGRRSLIGRAKQRCERCDRPFVAAEPRSRCPICEDDEDVFGDIFG